MIYTVNLWLTVKGEERYLSSTLLEKIEWAIKNGKKTIIYLNKRGEHSSLICKNCQKIYSCTRCDSKLAVHKTPPQLLCHFCSYSEPIHQNCTACKSSQLEKVGVGTQQIETSLNRIFEGKNIFRADLDNLKNKKVKKEFQDSIVKADIIIGTKMITTGLDIEKIGCIWVVLLEQELQIPGYDTEEKVYTNIKQLLWRGGRKWESCDFVIQTKRIRSMSDRVKLQRFFLKDTSRKKNILISSLQGTCNDYL
jgi:primosomal protein N' (replication factor Y)